MLIKRKLEAQFWISKFHSTIESRVFPNHLISSITKQKIERAGRSLSTIQRIHLI